MPKVPFVGGSYQMEGVSFDTQRTVNLYPILSESQSSKSVAALRSTSGLRLFSTLGGGSIRGCIESQGRAFFVSGNGFYELFEDATYTLHDTIDTNVGFLQIEENPTQLMIIDSLYGYIFNKTTDTLTKITDVDFPVPSSLTFQDGFFLVTEKDTNKLWKSNVNNGLAWDALDFGTVEASADELVGAFSDRSNVLCFGTKITEVFQNTGAGTFPFQRINGAIIETGCAAIRTVQRIGNIVLWLGTDENGDDVVWQLNGYSSAAPVSTQAIQRKISESENTSESYAWVYHERGHAFYALQIKGLNTTLVYDISVGLWHERTYRNPLTGAQEQHRGSCHIFAFRKHLVGDRISGNVYEMALDEYTDNGDPIVRERISPHYAQEKQMIGHAKFELDMEVGVGLQSGQGSDPQVMLQYSNDGGHTWSDELWKPMGGVGQYKTRVRWTRLGRSRDRVYRVRVSDPVFVQINEAIINGA